MNTKLDKVIEPALDIVETAKAAADFCYKKVLIGDIRSGFYSMLEDISAAVSAVNTYIKPYLTEIRPNALPALCSNIIDSIRRYSSVPFESLPYPVFTYENEIKAAVYGLYESLVFSFVIYPDEEKLREFYKTRDALCERARSLNITEELAKIDQPYDVTMIIITYNLLDYFKQCFESILKFTDFEKYRVQLVIFDHGSSDGTLEYLKQYENLKFLKIHHCKENIKHELTFVTKNSNWYDTKYTMIIANDTIATKNYLDNLMTCIKSDDRIAWICPSMSNTSNNQGIPVQYGTIEEMHRFTENYNHSDPSKWEELSRLIPVFSVYNNVCRKALDQEDPGYYEFFFGDDDISRAFIRAGFRLLVCKDTYIHHYPSMTVSGTGMNERMYAMRKYFYNKFRYDAWNIHYFHNYFMLEDNINADKKQKFLFIEPGIGASVQYVRTLLHKNSIPLEYVQVHSVSMERRYLADMEGYSHKATLVKDYDEILDVYGPDAFDLIIIPDFLERLNVIDFAAFFTILKKLLNRHGVIKCGIKNYYYFGQIDELLTFQVHTEESDFEDGDIQSIRFLKLFQMNNLLKRVNFSKVTYINANSDEAALKQQYNFEPINNLQKKLLKKEYREVSRTQYYIFELAK